nr:DUF333 domain-containing protein [uncultured Enterobacter sp.]
MRLFLLALSLPLVACSSPPEAPAFPEIGRANPAAVYCLQKRGERVPVQTPQGISTKCRLPGGETLDEWALFRRDHPAPGA